MKSIFYPILDENVFKRELHHSFISFNLHSFSRRRTQRANWARKGLPEESHFTLMIHLFFTVLRPFGSFSRHQVSFSIRDCICSSMASLLYFASIDETTSSYDYGSIKFRSMTLRTLRSSMRRSGFSPIRCDLWEEFTFTSGRSNQWNHSTMAFSPSREFALFELKIDFDTVTHSLDADASPITPVSFKVSKSVTSMQEVGAGRTSLTFSWKTTSLDSFTFSDEGSYNRKPFCVSEFTKNWQFSPFGSSFERSFF